MLTYHNNKNHSIISYVPPPIITKHIFGYPLSEFDAPSVTANNWMLLNILIL
jgi:hypothetical protein